MKSVAREYAWEEDKSKNLTVMKKICPEVQKVNCWEIYKRQSKYLYCINIKKNRHCKDWGCQKISNKGWRTHFQMMGFKDGFYPSLNTGCSYISCLPHRKERQYKVHVPSHSYTATIKWHPLTDQLFSTILRLRGPEIVKGCPK